MRKTIGSVLREGRREVGLSLRDLERLTGLPAAAISQVETGARKDPGFSTVLKIARAIGMSMEDVAHRVEGRTPQKDRLEASKSIAAISSLVNKAHAESGKISTLLSQALEEIHSLRAPRKRT